MISKDEEETFNPFHEIFPDEDSLFAYFAGFYEASGTITIQNRNLRLNISGNYKFLNKIKYALDIGIYSYYTLFQITNIRE